MIHWSLKTNKIKTKNLLTLSHFWFVLKHFRRWGTRKWTMFIKCIPCSQTVQRVTWSIQQWGTWQMNTHCGVLNFLPSCHNTACGRQWLTTPWIISCYTQVGSDLNPCWASCLHPESCHLVGPFSPSVTRTWVFKYITGLFRFVF